MKLNDLRIAPASKEMQERQDLLRRARGVFGADCTMQLYGAGGRIIAEDGRKLLFGSMAELAQLIDKEQTDAPGPPAVEERWWYPQTAAR